MTGLRLVEPTLAWAAEIRAFRRDFLENGYSMDDCGSLRRFEDPRDWIDQTEQLKREETTPPGLVPATHYLCVREADRRMVGVVQLRHRLNDFLEKYAGHVGYSVCPGERRKGCATEMLRLVLPECRALGLRRVLLCCRTDNEGSRRTILHNGGVYESTVYLAERGAHLERYWIDLGE